MTCRIFLVLTLAVIPKVTKPQSVSTLMGARSVSLGNASTTLNDEWSLFNNPGGMSDIQSTTANFAYSINPALPGADRLAAGITAPLKLGVLGSGVFRFGDELYSEQLLSLGYANKLGLASLGMKINYVQYRAEGFGTNSAFSLNFGGIAELSPVFMIGAYITNINQPKISDDENLPAKLATGIQFKPDNNLLLLLELEKDLNYDPTIKGGVEYALYKKIDFRVGFNLNPNSVHGGIGYQTSRLVLGYGVQYSAATQFQFQFSTGYKFKRHIEE